MQGGVGQVGRGGVGYVGVGGCDIQGWCGLCRGRVSGSCRDRGGLCVVGYVEWGASYRDGVGCEKFH